MHFLSITSSKSAPKLRRFQHFDLENLLFDRPEPQNIGKTLENTVRNSNTLEKRSVWECSTSSRAWIFFLLTRSSLTLPKTVAAFVHKSGVWLLNFLNKLYKRIAPGLLHVCCRVNACDWYILIDSDWRVAVAIQRSSDRAPKMSGGVGTWARVKRRYERLQLRSAITTQNMWFTVCSDRGPYVAIPLFRLCLWLKLPVGRMTFQSFDVRVRHWSSRSGLVFLGSCKMACRQAYMR